MNILLIFFEYKIYRVIIKRGEASFLNVFGRSSLKPSRVAYIFNDYYADVNDYSDFRIDYLFFGLEDLETLIRFLLINIVKLLNTCIFSYNPFFVI